MKLFLFYFSVSVLCGCRRAERIRCCRPHNALISIKRRAHMRTPPLKCSTTEGCWHSKPLKSKATSYALASLSNISTATYDNFMIFSAAASILQWIFMAVMKNAFKIMTFCLFVAPQASFLDPGHYQDVVTERALSGLCGYPLCNNTMVTPQGKTKCSAFCVHCVDANPFPLSPLFYGVGVRACSFFVA